MKELSALAIADIISLKDQTHQGRKKAHIFKSSVTSYFNQNEFLLFSVYL